MISRGKCGRGWRFVPVECLQIIAHKLFVETRRAFARRILIGRPEARGIGSQTFVDEQQFIADHSEFEFRVRDNDSASGGVFASALDKFSDLDRAPSRLIPGPSITSGLSEDRCSDRDRRRLLVEGVKIGPGNFDASCSPSGSFTPQTRPGFLVILPTGTSEVTADNTLDRGAARSFLRAWSGPPVDRERHATIGKFIEVRGDEMVSGEVEFLKPESGDLIRDRALVQESDRAKRRQRRKDDR